MIPTPQGLGPISSPNKLPAVPPVATICMSVITRPVPADSEKAWSVVSGFTLENEVQTPPAKVVHTRVIKFAGGAPKWVGRVTVGVPLMPTVVFGARPPLQLPLCVAAT